MAIDQKAIGRHYVLQTLENRSLGHTRVFRDVDREGPRGSAPLSPRSPLPHAAVSPSYR